MKSALLFTGALLCACAIWFISPYMSWDGSGASFLTNRSSDASGVWLTILIRVLFSPVMVISLAVTMTGLLLSSGLALYKQHYDERMSK